MTASWSCTIATLSGDWVGLTVGVSGGTALWYKLYGAGVKSDSLDTSYDVDYYAWKVPAGTGIVYSFMYVRNGAIVAVSSPMTSA